MYNSTSVYTSSSFASFPSYLEHVVAPAERRALAALGVGGVRFKRLQDVGAVGEDDLECEGGGGLIRRPLD